MAYQVQRLENWNEPEMVATHPEGQPVVAGTKYIYDDLLAGTINEHNYENDIVLIGDLPSREVLTLDLRTAVERLDTDGAFEIGVVLGNTTVFIKKLEGESNDLEIYYWLTFSTQRADGKKTATILIVKNDGLDNAFKLVGFTQSTIDNQGDASGDFSDLKDLYNPITQNLSQQTGLSDTENELINAVAVLCKDRLSDVAVRVTEEFKGKGYGKLLWLLTLASLEFLGASSRTIMSDITRGQKIASVKESFYEAMGAKPILFIDEVVTLEGESNTLVASKRLVSSTYLTDEQVRFLFSKAKG